MLASKGFDGLRKSIKYCDEKEYGMVGSVKKIAGAFLLSLLLGILGITIAKSSLDTVIFLVFFLVGLVAFSIILLKVNRAGFWFCLVYAIEWLLLPVLAYVYATQQLGSGIGGIGAGIGIGLILILLILVGVVGFIVFVALALWRYRKSG
jgi:hypothetical protein